MYFNEEIDDLDDFAILRPAHYMYSSGAVRRGMIAQQPRRKNGMEGVEKETAAFVLDMLS